MENHLYSTLQSPYSPVASLGMPWSKTQFHNNEIDGYQDIHLLPATIMPFNYTIPAGGALFSSPATPIASDLGSPTVIDFRAMHSNNGHMSKAQAVKRRMQNREAQRRLRERKEEQQKILEENTAKLEARIAELSAGLSEKSEEESRILKEKDALAKEYHPVDMHVRSLNSLNDLAARTLSLFPRESPASGLRGTTLETLNAMTNEPGNTGNELIFVNAPKIRAGKRTDGAPSIRSQMVRQLVRKKKANSKQQLFLKKPRSEGSTSPSGSASSADDSKSDESDEPVQSAYVVRPGSLTTPEIRARESSSDTEPGQTEPSLFTLLGAARSDPFSPWFEELGTRGHEVLDFCIRDFWPSLRTHEYAETCYRSRFQQGSRLTLYAVLWATSVHLDLYRDNPSESKESVGTLRYLDLSLQALQAHLASNDSVTVSDEAILCIIYLAVNHQVKPRLTRDPNPFTPPRTSVHHLNIFGTTTFHAAHWKMAKGLIHGKGGIHAIKMVTLPWLISIADLLHSVGALEKPTFPMLSTNGQPILYSSPFRALRVPEVPRHLSGNGGFTQLKSLDPPVRQSIVDVYLDISEYSQCLDFLEHSETCLVHELGDCRDIVHHRFMSLPDSHDSNELIMDILHHSPDACQQTRLLYFLLRLSGLLYITHVTFPLPRPLRLRKLLLSQLSTYCASIVDCNFSADVPLELFLWPATISAIAARDEPCRMQFILLVNKLCKATGILTWEQFRCTMRSFAWVDCACDQEGQHVWTDAQLLG
ncbi:hypothetical protein BJX63DRAFT_431408 [Aspergillus granulosus]|uniref:BZIP domain-containing protein n=1 Tax=Aspergillus granulosus TaxID=176169 RepID=A0ABR4HFJ1_9EURO